MKNAARKLLLPVMLMLVMVRPALGRGADSTPQAPPVPTTQRDLLAHGTDELFWSADVIPTSERRGGVVVNGVKTLVRVRSTGQPQWREIAPIAAKARDLANRGTELLVALDDGDWMIVTDDGARSGVLLPGGARMIAICGDEDDIWAVGVAAEKGKLLEIPPPTAKSAATTSRPSTTSVATAPTTAPAFPPHEVGLFQLRRGQWAERDVLPAGVRSGDIVAISLAMIDRRLMLAMATRDLVVRVWARDEAGKWDDGADVAVLASDKGKIKLMNLEGSAVLWIADGAASASNPGALLTRGQRWSEPKKLTAQPSLAELDRRTLSVALGRIRLLASDGRGRVKEQLYNKDGTLSGEPIDSDTIPRRGDDWLAHVFQLLVVIVLVVWMLGSMRQRPAFRDALARVDELHLAPLGRRLLGGLIDLLPFFIGMIAAEQALRNAPPPMSGFQKMTYDSPAAAWLGAGMGLYIGLATALELLTRGRSVGKLLTGTRVASLDGSRAVPAALLIRNLFRLVDILLMFFPLSFVLFSPLRQRIGDMAAGTIVIRNDAPERPPTPPPADDSSDES